MIHISIERGVEDISLLGKTIDGWQKIIIFNPLVSEWSKIWKECTMNL